MVEYGKIKRLVKKVSDLLRRITGLSTPLGGISWTLPDKPSIAKFTESVCLVDNNNDNFAKFLEVNRNKIITLNFVLDISVGTEFARKIVEQSRIIFDKIFACDFEGLGIPLLCRDKGIRYVAFYFSNPHPQVWSSGGTGVFQIPVRGFFEVSITAHGGPSIAFHLKEVSASVDLQLRVFEQ